MLSWAVSAVLLAGTFQQESALVEQIADRTARSVVVLESIGSPLGVAVLLDSEGHFLTQNFSASATPLYGVFPTGYRVALQFIASDSISGLVLLKALRLPESFDPITLTRSEPDDGEMLVAFTLSGFQSSQMSARDRVGVIRPSLSYVPLQEFRLELPSSQLSSALVFNQAGELVGLIGASLSIDSDSATDRSISGRAALGSTSGSIGGGGGAHTEMLSSYGPKEMVTGFSLGQVALKRVIDGFLSEGHQVEHPSIGVFFKSSTKGGAIIEELLVNGPAATAGLKVGDRIVAIDGKAVSDAFDLAARLFHLTVGEIAFVGVVRGDEPMEFEVEVMQRRTANHEPSRLDSQSLESGLNKG